jgi:hypothetical protein
LKAFGSSAVLGGKPANRTPDRPKALGEQRTAERSNSRTVEREIGRASKGIV